MYRKITQHLTIIVVLILTGCGAKPKEKANNEPMSVADSSGIISLTAQQYESAHIAVTKLQTRAIGTTLKLNGTLDVPPQNLISISAPLGGFVRSTGLLQGMKVKKGEVLATMENPEYIQLQQDYLENKSRLEYLKAEYNRQEELARENVNAKKALEQARSQYHTTQATVQGLKARLTMINISVASLESGDIRQSINLYAPIDGFVTVVNVNVGQFVSATEVMFKLVNIDHIHAELQVYEKDINKISVGQKVNFQLNHDTEKRTASVYLVGKEISPDRTVRIHCHLDKEDENLLPGMYVTATVQLGTHNATVVPSKSIVSFGGKDYVFAQLQNRQSFELVPVDAGDSDGEYTEVAMPTGFDAGRGIVSEGAFELLGMLKNVEE